MGSGVGSRHYVINKVIDFKSAKRAALIYINTNILFTILLMYHNGNNHF